MRLPMRWMRLLSAGSFEIFSSCLICSKAESPIWASWEADTNMSWDRPVSFTVVQPEKEPATNVAPTKSKGSFMTSKEGNGCVQGIPQGNRANQKPQPRIRFPRTHSK